MTTSDLYESVPREVHARQWRDHAATGGTARHMYADDIVAWVNANGGEARFMPESRAAYYNPHEMVGGTDACIRIRRREDGLWWMIKPGWWIIATGIWLDRDDEPIDNPGYDCESRQVFEVCDPETFTLRWRTSE